MDTEIELIRSAFDESECQIVGNRIRFSHREGDCVFNVQDYPENVSISVSRRGDSSRLKHDLHTLWNKEQSLFGLIAEAARSFSEASAEKEDTPLPVQVNTPNAKIVTRDAVVCLIYFHHIMAEGKKKAIRDESRVRNIGGVFVTGFPGVVVCEGFRVDIDGFIHALKRLRWQEIIVKGEESRRVTIGESDGNSAWRLFPRHMHKLDSLGELARACREADMENLYFSLRKG